jgi:hypothetical protein
MPTYECGLIDLSGKAIGTADKSSLTYLGDGLFPTIYEEIERQLRGTICNREGKKLNLSLSDGWVLDEIFVPNPGKWLDQTVNELPPNTLIALKNEKGHRLVSIAGDELIAARKEYFHCVDF